MDNDGHLVPVSKARGRKASIQALAARYGGVVYSRMEGQVIHFVAKIPLRLVKEAS